MVEYGHKKGCTMGWYDNNCKMHGLGITLQRLPPIFLSLSLAVCRIFTTV